MNGIFLSCGCIKFYGAQLVGTKTDHLMNFHPNLATVDPVVVCSIIGVERLRNESISTCLGKLVIYVKITLLEHGPCLLQHKLT